MCPQTSNSRKIDNELSEDCLYLNIFAPSNNLLAFSKTSRQKMDSDNEKILLPVMIYFHGGGYRQGSSNTADGSFLVQASKSGVIVVTFNYRINIFGFLGGEQIANHTVDGSSGNFGIQDQQMAMRWVHNHIHAFGGDNRRITIFGQSAGANSIINHLV